ncbi:MAG: DNA polymerase III subunit epsilon [Pseudomonadota bacterium]
MSLNRQIVLDTETTGLDPAHDHRIIEIGCVELVNRRVTGKTWHRYLNPDRRIDEGAIAVHGIRNEDLADQPRFPDVADEFLEFIVGAELVIHNAPFDVGFIEHELRRMGHKRQRLSDLCPVLDSLVLAREKHPGARNSLDALCKRYQVDNSGRELHGALLDARLLGDVYLLMTGGQNALFDDSARQSAESADHAAPLDQRVPLPRLHTPVIEPTAEELAAHAALLERIAEACGGVPVWSRSGKVTK